MSNDALKRDDELLFVFLNFAVDNEHKATMKLLNERNRVMQYCLDLASLFDTDNIGERTSAVLDARDCTIIFLNSMAECIRQYYEDVKSKIKEQQ